MRKPKEVFIVEHEAGYDEADRRVWRASIREALEAIARDAHIEVEMARMRRWTNALDDTERWLSRER